ncbi:hypothetical protein DICPUDRAFT_152010 [Dictyostelium purpureum]|uniref:Uncharacterized protein n=1 Tax=Dictyostelium purpureum TaxID=5786 RepID=F0ZK94_DICPU|nr:uncharacterized protein DICPUDRAFT_152010 [Dictyostelium purpureum]EGC35646.1 hypothetical protein DICPUDRAFT_152010 [Dictyostelium purpureum]|eukprot:XP_003287825.1 hypothetical protein DICPUDRAFT_152010 [Dictyostelium purpureum]
MKLMDYKLYLRKFKKLSVGLKMYVNSKAVTAATPQLGSALTNATKSVKNAPNCKGSEEIDFDELSATSFKVKEYETKNGIS